jgi:hypothetical protein
LIKIYEVIVRYKLNEEDKIRIFDNNIGQFEDVKEVPDMSEGLFHVGAYSLLQATLLAQENGDTIFDEMEILSIKEMEEINLINWQEDECPYCAAEDAAPEDILEFDCTCGAKIKVADNGWEHIDCFTCGKIIDRNHVIGSNGKYILIEAGENKSE